MEPPGLLSPLRLRPAGRLREALAVLCAGAALAVLLTYPLATTLGTHARVDSSDGHYSIWSVAWVAKSLTSNPLDLLHPPVFYPHKQVLAYSEMNLGAGVLAIPAWLMTGDAITAHNSAVLLSFVLSFVFTYALARHLGATPLPGATAALLYAFTPFVFARLPHIQLLMTWGLPACLLLMHRLVDRPVLARALALGVMLALYGMTSASFALLSGLLCLTGGIYFGVTRGGIRRADHWLAFGLAAFVTVALLTPAAAVYIDLQASTGFGRSLEEARRLSPNAAAWLASSSWVHSAWLPAIAPNEVLFPGAVATVCGVSGLVAAMRRRSAQAVLRRDVSGFYLLAAILSVWLALGPDAGLFRWAGEVLPFMSFFRAPARFAIALPLALSIFTAALLATIVSARPSWRPAVAIVFGVAMLELWNAPLAQLRPVPPLPRPVQTLAGLPRGVVIEYPFYATASQWHGHARYMTRALAHGQPLLNGYSDHIPAEFRLVAPSVAHLDQPGVFDLLASMGVTYVLVNRALYPEEVWTRVTDALARAGDHLVPIDTDDNVALYALTIGAQGRP